MTPVIIVVTALVLILAGGWARTLRSGRSTVVSLPVGGDRVIMDQSPVGALLLDPALQIAWVNDAFWLNPLAKLRDEGVSLAVVDDDGEESLLVSYASGGLTPGDAYLWRVGPDGTPTAWKLWVSILPIGGVETSWEGWVTLDTGARISTRHAGPLGLTLELTDVEGATTLDALVDGPDPFAPLFEREEGD